MAGNVSLENKERADKEVRVHDDELGTASIIADLHNMDPASMDLVDHKNLMHGTARYAQGDKYDEAQTTNAIFAVLARIEANQGETQRRIEMIEKEQQAARDFATKHKTEMSPEDKAVLQAQEQKRLQDMIRLNSVNKKYKVKELLAEPREMVVWPGKVVNVRHGGTKDAVPEFHGVELPVLGITLRYAAGERVEVPKSVAARLRDYTRSEQEQKQRMNLMDAKTIKHELSFAKSWQRIGNEFNSPAGAIQLAGD